MIQWNMNDTYLPEHSLKPDPGKDETSHRLRFRPVLKGESGYAEEAGNAVALTEELS